MPLPVVAIAHPATHVAKHYAEEDLARLRAVADLRILGSSRFPDIANQLAEVEMLSASWGMPRLDAALLAAAPRLRAVCYAAGSVKHFVTDESYARQIVITSAWRANAVPVAETCLALITLATKGWFVGQDRIRRLGLSGFHHHEDGRFPGNFKTTIGLVGFGAIGRMVAERLRQLDNRVLVYDPYVDAAELSALGLGKVDDLVELAAASTVLSVHAPNIPACRRMINASVLAALPEGATLINTARGALVDEAALIAELELGRIYAYLDVTDPEPPVPESPLYRLPNCWLTPHRAGSSGREIQRMGRSAVDEMLRIIAGQPPQHAVSQAMLATMA